MDQEKKEYKTPAGTITIMVIFILLIIALWGSVYLTLLSRGVTG
ncbi:MAG: cytochrome c oxidase subunit 2A [Chloroflexi bacterium]|nr:cytochrome c oxidase subunit 2A [Chloroflexota bacterium]